MKKALLIALVLVLALGAGAAGGYFFMKGRGAAEAKAPVEKAKKGQGAGFKVGELTTNLAGGGRYIQVEVEVRVKDEKAAKEMEHHSALVRDTMLAVLRSKTIRDVDGREGMERLRQELQARLNEALEEPLAEGVYFSKFIVQ